METNLMLVNFARRANTADAGKGKAGKKGKAILKGLKQAGKGKGKAPTKTLFPQSPAQQKQQSQQQAQQQSQQQAQQQSQQQAQQQQTNEPQQPPINTLAGRTQQAIEKKKRLAGRGTMGTMGALRAV